MTWLVRGEPFGSAHGELRSDSIGVGSLDEVGHVELYEQLQSELGGSKSHDPKMAHIKYVSKWPKNIRATSWLYGTVCSLIVHFYRTPNGLTT